MDLLTLENLIEEIKVKPKKKYSFRLDEDIGEWLAKFSKKHNLSQADVVSFTLKKLSDEVGKWEKEKSFTPRADI